MKTQLTRRSMLKWGLLGTSTCVLAACAPKTPTAAPAKEAATVAPAATEAPKAPAEPITLVVWNQDNFGQEDWDEISKAFEDSHEGIKIDMTLMPYADTQTKILTALAGGVELDVNYVHPMTNALYALKGVSIALDDYMEDLGVPADDWYPCFQYGVWRSKTWAVPHQNTPTMLGYNPTILEAEGYPDPWELFHKGEWTLEKYEEMATQLTKGEGADKRFGSLNIIWASIRGTQAMYIWGFGDDVFTEDEMDTHIDSDKAIEAWNRMAKPINDGIAPLAGDIQGITGAALWEKCVMGTANRWTLKQAAGGGNILPVKMVPWFTYPISKKAEVRDATCSFNINSMSKHKAEAWAYNKFMVLEGMVILTKQGWSTPMRKSLKEADYFMNMIDKRFESAELYDVSNTNVRVLNHVPNMNEIDKIIQPRWDQVLLEDRDTYEAMKEAADEVRVILADNAKQTLPS
jgi:ABC-type glycerol-3-phosphate transport system substrate-binding protein